MMNGFSNMMDGFGLGGLVGTITWLALIFFLVAGGVYFWKQINKK